MQTDNKDDVIEIDMKEVFFEILNHRRIIILSTIMVGLIAFIISRYMITPLYKSTSQLYVLSKSTSITSLADIQTGTSLTNDYMVVVKGRTVLEQVIENLKLTEDYEKLPDRVMLNNPSDSRILEISVLDKNAERAKKITDEIANVASAFIAEKMDQDSPTTIQYGYADGEPVSPNIVKNTAIGAVVGLLLAVCIVVLTYLLNDTVMTTEDIEQKLNLHVLGTLPLEDKEEKRHQSVRKHRK